MNTIFSIPIFRPPSSAEEGDPLSDFLRHYPGKLLVTGPEDALTPETITRIVATYKKILDAEPSDCRGGIYSQETLTLFYEPHPLRL